MNTSYIQSGTLSSKIFNNYHKTNIEGNEDNEDKLKLFFGSEI